MTVELVEINLNKLFFEYIFVFKLKILSKSKTFHLLRL